MKPYKNYVMAYEHCMFYQASNPPEEYLALIWLQLSVPKTQIHTWLNFCNLTGHDKKVTEYCVEKMIILWFFSQKKWLDKVPDDHIKIILLL